MKSNLLIVLLVCLLIGAQSCLPAFSELQSARLAGKGNIEVTPHYSSVGFAEDGESDALQKDLGLQAAIGLGPKFDLRMRYVKSWEDGSDFSDGVSAICMGPKWSLSENKIAAYLPVGRALGDGTSDTWYLMPTMLFTLPAVENKLEITLAPKYMVPFSKDYDDYLVVNLGLAISSNLSRWAIRPEYGHLYNPGESGHASQFSIGVSGVINGK